MAVRGVLVGLMALTAALVPLGPRAAQAASPVTVATCDEAHLRAAITAAGAGGTVTFGCSGTITLASTITLSQDVTIDGAGQAVTISGGHTAQVTGVRVFIVNSGVTASLSHLTISGGNATGSFGGGIVNSGTLTVTNSTLSGSIGDGGGGIFNGGTLTVANSTFSGNSASGGLGGAIFSVGGPSTAVTVTGCTFSGNSASGNAGAISIINGTLTVSTSTFSGNHAAAHGGAIDSPSVMNLIVTGSTFSGNSADTGGAIAIGTGSVAVTNSTFSGNSATTDGGAFTSVAGANNAVTNSTFSGNSAASGGAIANLGGSVTVANTITANSPSGGNCFGIVTDSGGNLDDGATCGFGTAHSNANPQLGPLANNGGPVAGAADQPATGVVRTMALPATSPAVGLGLAATCLTAGPAGVNDVDERGLPRYAALRGVCDSGAYDTGGGLVPPLTISGAIPLTAGVPARLGFAASNHATTFAGVAGLAPFNVGYITFQLGPNTFTVRQPVAMACTPDHCVGTTGLVNGLPGFVALPDTATVTLSGTISSGRGIFPQGATAMVTLSLSASAAGVVTVSKVTVAVAGVNGGNPIATWAATFPAGTSIQVNDAAPLIP